LFKYQAKSNEVYGQYITYLGLNPDSIHHTSDIPFLPIGLYKEHLVKTDDWAAEAVFESSGTTSQVRSIHHVRSLAEYSSNAQRIFENFYGSFTNKTFLALLPSYIERGNSSLVYMIQEFMHRTGDSLSGFFLNDHEKLIRSVTAAQEQDSEVIIFGVTFALLRLAEESKMPMNGVTIIETGGMKGRGRELTRKEVHEILLNSFTKAEIHSEYGMTELMSQAYAKANGLFKSPPWMKVYVRDITDPLTMVDNGLVGALNVIDLANIHTCAFVETEDLGKRNEDYSFEVLGRMDNSEVRGCNILVS